MNIYLGIIVVRRFNVNVLFIRAFLIIILLSVHVFNLDSRELYTIYAIHRLTL